MLEGKKILVIDDNQNDIAIIKLLLPGVNVISNTKFGDDLEYIYKEKPDCILLGYSFQYATKVLRELKNDKKGREIPVIMLTESESADLAVEITQKGANDYLIKGFFSRNTLNKSIFLSIERQKLINTVYEQQKELEKLAIIDELTGINNRRSLIENIDKHIGLSKRYKFPLSLAICDIDEFKYINDNYGHIIGDSIIKEIAGIIKSRIRKSDIAGRHGGDEFVVLFPNTSQVNALRVMESIREVVLQACQYSDKFNRIKKMSINQDSSNFTPLKVSISVGVAEYSDFHETGDDFIAQADEALYFVKKNGRNAVAYKTRNCLEIFKDPEKDQIKFEFLY